MSFFSIFRKISYNFVTDPRMKRGHNFGVVYVTSEMPDENEDLMISQTKQPRQQYTKLTKKEETEQKEVVKLLKLYYRE